MSYRPERNTHFWPHPPFIHAQRCKKFVAPSYAALVMGEHKQHFNLPLLYSLSFFFKDKQLNTKMKFIYENRFKLPKGFIFLSTPPIFSDLYNSTTQDISAWQGRRPVLCLLLFHFHYKSPTNPHPLSRQRKQQCTDEFISLPISMPLAIQHP